MILVIAGMGFIGTHVVKSLLDGGEDVVVTYNNSWRVPDFWQDEVGKRVTVEKLDVANAPQMIGLATQNKVDGIIYHDAKTCPNNTNCRYGMPQRLEQQTGVPSLIINADLNDLRLVSDEQTQTNVEAFIEQLEENQT